MPGLAVVIPTFNRADVLRRCLEALEPQTVAHDVFEVVVVDDGSSDATAEVVAQFSARSPLCVSYHFQPNKGPAAARNLGIRVAESPLLLFIGDDIIATPDLVAQHLEWQQRYPQPNYAILGFTTWSREVEITPLMDWLEHGGGQFNYDYIRHGETVGAIFFYTSNVSVKRQFLLDYGLFDEDFPYAAYEDLELAHRLEEAGGLMLLFNARAVAYHLHPVDLPALVRRGQAMGRSRLILDRKHPGLMTPIAPLTVPQRLKRLVASLLFPVASTLDWRRAMHAYYRFRLLAAQRRAYAAALAETVVNAEGGTSA